jgi:hypothetical protein
MTESADELRRYLGSCEALAVDIRALLERRRQDATTPEWIITDLEDELQQLDTIIRRARVQLRHETG